MVFSKFVDIHFTALLFSSGRLYRSTVIKRCKFEPGSTFTGFSNFLFDLIFCWKDFPWPEVRKNFIVSYVRCTHMCDTYAEINLRGSLKAEGKIFLYILHSKKSAHALSTDTHQPKLCTWINIFECHTVIRLYSERP